MAELNPFKIAQKQLDTAAATLGLDEATHELLRWPQRELQVVDPRAHGRRFDEDFPRLPRAVSTARAGPPRAVCAGIPMRRSTR